MCRGAGKRGLRSRKLNIKNDATVRKHVKYEKLEKLEKNQKLRRFKFTENVA